MLAKRLTPILNVSDITESFVWFEKLGWKKGWDWGDPPTFGGVCSGECEIFLCQGAQGGRGNGGVKMTFGPDADETADKGVWTSIWVDDVDAIHRQCLEHGLEVAWPPTDMPWGVREMHVRHPDGHVFRISKGIEDTDEAQEPPVKVEGRDDLAYVLGTYTLTMAPPGAPGPVQDSGKYVEIQRRQADGRWLVAVDIFNSDLPVPPPPKWRP